MGVNTRAAWGREETDGTWQPGWTGFPGQGRAFPSYSTKSLYPPTPQSGAIPYTRSSFAASSPDSFTILILPWKAPLKACITQALCPLVSCSVWEGPAGQWKVGRGRGQGIFAVFPPAFGIIILAVAATLRQQLLCWVAAPL